MDSLANLCEKIRITNKKIKPRGMKFFSLLRYVCDRWTPLQFIQQARENGKLTGRLGSEVYIL